MAEPILDPEYWKNRLGKAVIHGDLHRSIFVCNQTRWWQIEEQHRQILAATIKDNDSILDVGCGWGRLLDLLPATWQGRYLGIDLSPDFIQMAQQKHNQKSNCKFFRGEIEEVLSLAVGSVFDWAVLISFRPMMINNLGLEAWEKTQARIQAASRRQLYLEYLPEDQGCIE